MRFSKALIPTLKEDPKDAELPSHRLMIRAGLVRPLAAGIYTYLPLGWRVLRKISRILREEMDRIGGQELLMPVVHPAELWQETRRWYEVGPELVRWKDRAGRDLVLGMTHEEVITDIARRELRSYRQLPQMLYQIQTKFRDEPRPRGGLIRVREFHMKDAYSFHASQEDLDAYYPQVYQAYVQIFRRCGLEVEAVEADPGMMGGSGSHEFMFAHPLGEDLFVRCSACDYAANLDAACARLEAVGAEEEPGPLEEVATPRRETIEEVARYLGVPTRRTAKAVFYKYRGQGQGQGEGMATATATAMAFVVIRGDLEVNEAKLARALGAAELEPADEAEIAALGAVPGFASPVGLDLEGKARLIVDPSVAQGRNLISGANRPDTHLKNVNYGRDFQGQVADVACARDGDACPRCEGGRLELRRGIEMGHIFKLGTRYSAPLGATFLDRDGREKPLVMGCYGIGSGRLLSAVIEAHHDERGIRWPKALAPFDVEVLVLNADDPAQRECASSIYRRLRAAGLEVLLDDRAEASAGVKFKDAELLGIPLFAVIGPQGLAQEAVEFQRRADGRKREVPLEGDVVQAVRRELDALA